MGAALAVLTGDIVLGTPGALHLLSADRMPVATTIFDRHDEAAFWAFEERRLPVPLEQVSSHMLQALIAVEDQRFYDHRGLDVWRIGGAALANLRGGGWIEGGSTLTQQLARQLFLTREKSLRRKAKEAVLAVRLEARYSKAEILETYLNKVYFGAGFYGVEAAARGYFDKAALDLTLGEAALLAGLVKAPSAYAPTAHLDRALERRAVVLQQMVDAGFIGQDAAGRVARSPVTLAAGFADEQVGEYFRSAVVNEIADELGWDVVLTGGLRVYTTFDPAVQRSAEEALKGGLDAIEGRRGYRHDARADWTASGAEGEPTYLQGALVALDPATGAVRALVGGRNFAESQFDRVRQARRQPGSAFKPFVYAAALEMGYSPAALITGLEQPFLTPQGEWVPADAHADDDAMTVRTALRTSSNRAAAQVLRAVSIPRAVAFADTLGLTAPPVPSLVLGSGEVSLLSLTTAYGAFANGGWLRTPQLIRRVEDASGRVLFDREAEARQVVSEATAFQMAQMLADVVDRGTGYAARREGFRHPAGGKTGTTNDYQDAWFVGFTPSLVAGVWVGFDQPRQVMANGYSSHLAVPIWGRFMRDAVMDEPRSWIERPDDVVAVEICRESGLLPGSGCSRVRRTADDGATSEVSTIGVEYFRRGHEPDVICPLHHVSWFFGRTSTRPFDPNEFPADSTIGGSHRRRPAGSGGQH